METYHFHYMHCFVISHYVIQFGYLHCLILQYHSPEESHEPRLKSVSAYFLCITLVKTPDDQTLSTQKRIHTCHKPI